MQQELLKIWRSPESDFGVHVEKPDDLQDETFTAIDTYTDKVLSSIAKQNFNAIWIHGQLQHLVKSSIFPELTKNSEKHISSIELLIKRAKKYGITVLLYLQPPRAIAVSNHEFWDNHQEVSGQLSDCCGNDNKNFLTKSLCTSHPKVLKYLKEAFSRLTKKLPDLGGYIIISASEYPSHCYARRNCSSIPPRKRKLTMEHRAVDCPRCKQFEPEDVVVSLLNTIRDGVRAVSKKHELIFWNWSWSMYLDPPCESIISRLPQDCVLMADFERGGYREDGTFINEYSLGYAGPSEDFCDIFEIAEKYDIQVAAKLQIGTTHELATVRSLPIMNSLFRKADFIRRNHLAAFLGCWNFGNLDSANISAFNFFLSLPEDIAEEEALTKFADSYFSGCNAPAMLKAWALFSEAMERYPFCVPFLYYSPVNHSLALIPEPAPLTGKELGRSWLPDERGDDYKRCITKEFSLNEIIERLQYLKDKWRKGLEFFREGIENAENKQAQIEFGNAAICSAVWESSYLMLSIYRLRLHWKESMRDEYNKLSEAELKNLKEVLPYVKQDQCQGFHLEGRFHSFSLELISEKINAIENQSAS